MRTTLGRLLFVEWLVWRCFVSWAHSNNAGIYYLICLLNNITNYRFWCNMVFVCTESQTVCMCHSHSYGNRHRHHHPRAPLYVKLQLYTRFVSLPLFALLAWYPFRNGIGMEMKLQCRAMPGKRKIPSKLNNNNYLINKTASHMRAQCKKQS